jgi:DNA-binding PadR family transcriptional regulator
MALKSRVQDEILLLLSNEPLHGYSVWNSILDDYPEMRLNTLYRWMNDLEARGLIEGNIELGDKGPNRKVYFLTQDGRQRVFLLIKNAFKLMIDVYRRYRLFSALHFSNLSQLSEVNCSNSRALIAPFNQFLDFDYNLIQILIDTMRGRRVDIIGRLQGTSNMHPKPRIMSGNIQNLPAKKDVYGDIWLIGLPKRSSFSPSIEECKRTLMKGGTLFLAIPFLTPSVHTGLDFGSFISNSMMQISPELELMEFHEIESIMKEYFRETGVIEPGILVFWGKK